MTTLRYLGYAQTRLAKERMTGMHPPESPLSGVGSLLRIVLATMTAMALTACGGGGEDPGTVPTTAGGRQPREASGVRFGLPTVEEVRRVPNLQAAQPPRFDEPEVKYFAAAVCPDPDERVPVESRRMASFTDEASNISAGVSIHTFASPDAAASAVRARRGQQAPCDASPTSRLVEVTDDDFGFPVVVEVVRSSVIQGSSPLPLPEQPNNVIVFAYSGADVLTAFARLNVERIVGYRSTDERGRLLDIARRLADLAS